MYDPLQLYILLFGFNFATLLGMDLILNRPDIRPLGKTGTRISVQIQDFSHQFLSTIIPDQYILDESEVGTHSLNPLTYGLFSDPYSKGALREGKTILFFHRGIRNKKC